MSNMEKTDRLVSQVEQMMAELGFEALLVRGQTNYRLGTRYVRFSFGNSFAVTEIADGRDNAEKNLYEDLDLYEYSYVESQGMDVFEEIRNDIIKYVVERENRN